VLTSDIHAELLVAFFKNVLPSLAPSTPSSTSSIIITLFEGEPYTLWNIRDLARHSGLQVEKSFKFQAKAYPGYKHARTLGVVRGRNGQVGGGWKGEQRSARSYVFVRKGEASIPGMTENSKKGNESSSDDSGDELMDSEGIFADEVQGDTQDDGNEDGDSNQDDDD
jgi:25S rRNA (uracil2634-N3)-methyltransferase